MSPSIPPVAPTPVSNPNARMQIIAQALIGLALVGFVAFKFPGFATKALSFVVTLSILVFVHEWGHFQFARWAGMRVKRFAIGFPPFIFNRQKNGITYSIGALPVGGMVDIAGLGSEEEMVGTATTGGKRGYQRDPSRPFGQKQFQDAGLGWRFWVLFAGPLMNFLFAIVAFVAVYSIAGVPEPQTLAEIQSVTPNKPAAKAGLKPKDVITAFGSKKLKGTEEAIATIHGGTTAPTTITVLRGGKSLTLPITPALKADKKTPNIGIELHDRIIYRKVSPLVAIQQGTIESTRTALDILGFLKRAVSRDLSSEEVKSVGGPLRIAEVSGQASELGWATQVQFAAMLSVNLGLMNLLPLPALDGGRILFLAYELVMRRPFDSRKESLVHAAGMIMLLAFMLFLTLHDVSSMLFQSQAK